MLSQLPWSFGPITLNFFSAVGAYRYTRVKHRTTPQLWRVFLCSKVTKACTHAPCRSRAIHACMSTPSLNRDPPFHRTCGKQALLATLAWRLHGKINVSPSHDIAFLIDDTVRLPISTSLRDRKPSSRGDGLDCFQHSVSDDPVYACVKVNGQPSFIGGISFSGG